MTPLLFIVVTMMKMFQGGNLEFFSQPELWQRFIQDLLFFSLLFILLTYIYTYIFNNTREILALCWFLFQLYYHKLSCGIIFNVSSSESSVLSWSPILIFFYGVHQLCMKSFCFLSRVVCFFFSFISIIYFEFL